jgi:hypothetical protein
MKLLTPIVLALTLLGCATSTPPLAPKEAPARVRTPAPYSASEASRLMLCMSMTDNAMTIATYKVAGKPIDEVKALYKRGPQPTVTEALVDKVYGENTSNTWDYTVGFYKECAVNMVNMQAPRSDMAAYCMQNVMIATTAYGQKEARLPKETAYKRFAAMGDTPRRIVDNVYEQSGTRTETAMKTWNSCMASLTAH